MRGNSGDIVLSRPTKMGSSSPLGPVDLRRRDFLIRFCQGASAALIPAGLRGLGWPSLYSFDSAEGEYSSREFQLHPHYRMPRPLDALLLKTQAGLDEFLTGKYAHQISRIPSPWGFRLLRSPPYFSEVGKGLLPHFAGS